MDKALPSVGQIGYGQLVNLLIPLEPRGIFKIKCCILTDFEIVQTLVCRTVMKLCQASVWQVEVF